MRRRLIALGCLAALLSCSRALQTREQAMTTSEETSPPKPNVVVVLLDDVGFGHLSSFGGPIPTPNIDRVAARGLRYTSFHTTALCSPTRAALLTGRNHHAVGTGKITELVSDEPGYTGRIPTSAATFVEIFRQHGYATYALGKWHNTPVEDVTPNGPYDLWPHALGFDRFYGFMGGQTNQWAPNVWDDTLPIDPAVGHPGYFLDRDLGDHAIAYVAQHGKDRQPFLLYIATGSAHAPHHAPREVIDRNIGRFDAGWDVLREQTLARQKRMGIVPEETTLAPRPEEIPAWSSLSPREKRAFARMQEVFAGAVEYADEQLGRVLDQLEKTQQLDDTIVIVTSDNGASGEGGLIGLTNVFQDVNGIPTSLGEIERALDDLGGPNAINHYPAGWALAGNTPGRYWKQSTYEGGVRDPFVISWPNGIEARGGIRSRFTHVVDVAPTLLDLAGLAMPGEVNGVRQMPLAGESFVSSLRAARAPARRPPQYFEMFGNRAIWADGWKAVSFGGRMPWDHESGFDAGPWELFRLDDDPGESRDLAAREPEKLAELEALFDREARKNRVFPLEGASVALVRENMRRLAGQQTTFRYEGFTRGTPEVLSPPVKNRSHAIVARVHVYDGGAEGVLATCGGRFGGYALYVKDGRLTYAHDYVGLERYVVTSTTRVPTGDVTLAVVFEKTGENAGRARLFIDGDAAGEGDIPHTVPILYSATETFDTGLDTATAAGDYEVPFAFTGRLDSVTVRLLGD
ncbi:MAG: arylsulfatase [Labilithrix sp.]|nr:arylsulfatase [Labilithrix sp.]